MGFSRKSMQAGRHPVRKREGRPDSQYFKQDTNQFISKRTPMAIAWLRGSWWIQRKISLVEILGETGEITMKAPKQAKTREIAIEEK